MDSVITGIEIRGIAACVPGKWVDLTAISDEKDEVLRRFIRQTGIHGRYAANARQTASDLCFCAAERLLRETAAGRNEIGVLIFVSQTTDYRVPSTAFALQTRLGLGQDCLVFDVNLGCSGYVNGLNIAASLMKTSGARYGLLLAGDTAAREFSQRSKVKTDHSSSLLFGDAGTATLLEQTGSGLSPEHAGRDSSPERTGSGRLYFSSRSDGTRYQAIFAPYGFWRHPDMPEDLGNRSKMDDLEVFRFATNEVPEQISEYMAETGTTPEDYDGLALHQANLMIMKRIARKTGFPEDKLLVSLDRFANTSSASIPVTLVSAYGGQNEERIARILCSGFGVGLSWTTVSLEIYLPYILPLLQTDEVYDDGYKLTESD